MICIAPVFKNPVTSLCFDSKFSKAQLGHSRNRSSSGGESCVPVFRKNDVL